VNVSRLPWCFKLFGDRTPSGWCAWADALQGGSQPAEALARLRELNCPVVVGNADAWLITGQHTSMGEEQSRHQREVRAWSLAQLSQSDIAFVQHFRWKERVQVSPFVVFPSMSTHWPALSVPAAISIYRWEH